MSMKLDDADDKPSTPPYGLMKASERQTDGRAIAYSARRVKYTRNYGHYKKCGALDDERQIWRTSSTSVDSAKYKQ